jgi:predicted Zn-dependent protease
LAWSQIAGATARAQDLPLIRDSEIEDIIGSWADPLFAEARLDPASVRLLLVNDPSLNAFVAGGQNLFIYSGLLMASESPGQVIGVLAHETGHIAGGHLARSGDALRDAQMTGLFATLLGIGLIAIGAATGTRTGQAGGAVIAGGQSVGMRTFLAYTRSQERSADQAAVGYLDRTRQSARGMLAFLEKLADQELLSSARQDPYVRSHPLTAERIEFIAEHIRTSRWSDRQDPPAEIERHARMRAKLIAFLERPRRVLKTYFPETKTGLAARYGRAIAYFRLPDLEKGLAEIDALIGERPADPFFLELKGQMLFENGRVSEAIPHYEAAVARRPDDPLMLTGLAQVQLESGDTGLVAAAIANLERARRIDRENPMTWRLLSVGYHDIGDSGAASLAAGESALLIGRVEDARLHAGRAEHAYAEGSPGWLQAQDIKRQAEQLFNMRERARR